MSGGRREQVQADFLERQAQERIWYTEHTQHGILSMHTARPPEPNCATSCCSTNSCLSRWMPVSSRWSSCTAGIAGRAGTAGQDTAGHVQHGRQGNQGCCRSGRLPVSSCGGDWYAERPLSSTAQNQQSRLVQANVIHTGNTHALPACLPTCCSTSASSSLTGTVSPFSSAARSTQGAQGQGHTARTPGGCHHANAAHHAHEHLKSICLATQAPATTPPPTHPPV